MIVLVLHCDTPSLKFHVIDAGPEAMAGGPARRRLALPWGIAVITVVRRAGRTKLLGTSMEIGPKRRVAEERPPADPAGLSAVATKISSPAGGGPMMDAR